MVHPRVKAILLTGDINDAKPLDCLSPLMPEVTFIITSKFLRVFGGEKGVRVKEKNSEVRFTGIA